MKPIKGLERSGEPTNKEPAPGLTSGTLRRVEQTVIDAAKEEGRLTTEEQTIRFVNYQTYKKLKALNDNDTN